MHLDRILGYSCHCNDILMAALSVKWGAQIVEKHFTLDHTAKGSDHAMSLQPEGMRKLVRDLRRVKESIGPGVKFRLPEEESAEICVTVNATSGVVNQVAGTPPGCTDVPLSFPFAPKAAVLGINGSTGGTQEPGREAREHDSRSTPQGPIVVVVAQAASRSASGATTLAR